MATLTSASGSTNASVPSEIPGSVSKRKLHFFLLVDDSYSMRDNAKIQKVNYAIRQVLPELRRIEETERVSIYMRTIRFGDNAEWYLGADATPISEFEWQDLSANGGRTSTARAIDLLSDELDIEKLGRKNVPPVAILLSDGHSTDGESVYLSAVDRLNQLPWGKKAVRLSIGIDDYNKEELDAFISPYLRQECAVETLRADTPEKLVDFIKTVSVVASTSATRTNQSSSDTPVHIDKAALQKTKDDIDFSGINASEVF